MYSFDKLAPFAIGLDSAFKIADQIEQHLAKGLGNTVYPPYNIRKVDDNKFFVDVAVAGFSKDEVQVSLEDQVLKVTGQKKSEETNDVYLFRGLAARSFTRTFHLIDSIEVVGADIVDGVLQIELHNVTLETKKKTIPIGEKRSPEILNE